MSSHGKHPPEQWLICMLALMDFQLLVFLKGLLTAFKTALFRKGLLVLRKTKELTVHRNR
jgi:hypothetical protein